MTFDDLLPAGRFEFHRRTVEVPGDLRVSWRLSLVAIILASSRAKKASLAKVHLLSDALRNKGKAELLIDILEGRLPASKWRIRIEPALGRLLDIAVGENIISVESGPQYRITQKGIRLSASIRQSGEPLSAQRAFLDAHASRITEGFVADLVRMVSGR